MIERLITFMNNIGLVIEGGANRGIFTSGVLDFFKSQDLYLPYVVSVSVGTCNAIDYVSKQIERTKECMIPNGRNIPPINWRHLKDKKTMINLDMVFDEYPNKVVPFDYETYWKSNIISEYVVTNCLNGKSEYLSEKKDKNRLMNICRASCSMPYLSPVTMLDGVPYLDGGISDAIPIRRAMSLGFEKNIVILTREKGYNKKDSRIAKILSRIMYKDYPELIKQLDNRIYRYNETIRLLDNLEQKNKVLIIRPLKVLAGRMDNNVSHMNEFYKQGYNLAKENLDKIYDFIYK